MKIVLSPNSAARYLSHHQQPQTWIAPRQVTTLCQLQPLAPAGCSGFSWVVHKCFNKGICSKDGKIMHGDINGDVSK